MFENSAEEDSGNNSFNNKYIKSRLYKGISVHTLVSKLYLIFVNPFFEQSFQSVMKDHRVLTK